MARTKCSGVSQRPNKKGASSEKMLDDGGDSGYDGDGDGDGDGLQVRRKVRGRGEVKRKGKGKGRVKEKEGGILGGGVETRGDEVAEADGDGAGERSLSGKKTVCAVLMRYLGFSMRREGWVRR